MYELTDLETDFAILLQTAWLLFNQLFLEYGVMEQNIQSS